MKVNYVNLDNITDDRGSITYANTLPFSVKRFFIVDNLPKKVSRGNHAHKELFEILVALRGSFRVILNDKHSVKFVTLNNPNKGLVIPPKYWRQIDRYSSDAMCLVLCSQEFNDNDYIRDYSEFLKYEY